MSAQLDKSFNLSKKTSLVLIDAAVKDGEQLAASVPADTRAIVFDSNRDGIAQISEILNPTFRR